MDRDLPLPVGSMGRRRALASIAASVGSLFLAAACRQNPPAPEVNAQPSPKEQTPSRENVEYMASEISRLVRGSYAGAEVIRKDGVIEIDPDYPLERWVSNTFEGESYPGPTPAYLNRLGRAIFTSADGQRLRLSTFDFRAGAVDLEFYVQRAPLDEQAVRSILNLPSDMKFDAPNNVPDSITIQPQRVLEGVSRNPNGSVDTVRAYKHAVQDSVIYEHRP